MAKTSKKNEKTKKQPKKIGRPVVFTPDQLSAKFDEYVKWAEDHPLIVNQVSAGVIVPVPNKRPLSLSGFYVFAGISKDTFKNYENTPEYIACVTRVRMTVETDQLTGAIAGRYNAQIVARVLHLVERQDVTTNAQPITQGAPSINITLDEGAAKIIQSLGKMSIGKR